MVADKQQDLIIEPDEFPIFLKARMLDDTVAEYAAKLSVTPKLVYLLLSGERKPSKDILKKMGLRIVYAARKK